MLPPSSLKLLEQKHPPGKKKAAGEGVKENFSDGYHGHMVGLEHPTLSSVQIVYDKIAPQCSCRPRREITTFAQVSTLCSSLGVPVSALQQHLVHSRKEPQVAVDLEHRPVSGHQTALNLPGCLLLPKRGKYHT